MEEQVEQEVQEQEIVETETVEEQTEPTSEVVEEVSEEEVEVEEKPEPKTVPLDALQDERKKRQELERKLEEISEGVNTLKSQSPPKDIYEAYDRDSQGVVRDLNAEIKRLVGDDPYGNAAQIEQLRDLKDELRRREFTNIQSQLNQQTTASKVLSVITKEVPDFAKKVPELERFAIEELGYTPQELQKRTDFALGDDAAREVIRINKLYEKMTAKPQAKAVKPKPTKVEGPGQGVSKPEIDMNKLIQEAQKSGDWTKVFDARGLLGED